MYRSCLRQVIWIHVALDHLIGHVRFEPLVFLRAYVCHRSLCEPTKSDRKKQFYRATDRQINRLAQNSRSEDSFGKTMTVFRTIVNSAIRIPQTFDGLQLDSSGHFPPPVKKIHALHKSPLRIVRSLIVRISKPARSSRND